MNPRSAPDRGVILRASVDVVAVFVAFFVVYASYLGVLDRGWLDSTIPTPEIYGWLPLLFAVICVTVFAHMGLYRPFSGLLNLWELTTTTKGLLVTAGFFYAAMFALKVPDPSRYVVLGSTIGAGVLVLLGRRITAAWLLRRSLRVRDGTPVVIVGGGAGARLLYKKIVNAPHLQRRVVGFLDSRRPRGAVLSARVSGGSGVVTGAVLGHPRDLRRALKEGSAREVLVDAASLHPAELERVLEEAREAGVDIGIVPSIGQGSAEHYRVVDLSALPVLQPLAVAGGPTYLFFKRCSDLVGASLLLAVSLPLWPIIAFAIRMTSPGPVLFRQERVGQNGSSFEILKFRTMHAATDPYALSPNSNEDTRVTRIGRVLRLLGLDEIPQLLNVIKGDMTLVGPRPEMPFIAEGYTDVERRRLLVRPGITGPWQLSPDREAQIHENLEYDLYYVSHRSAMLDIVILVETLLYTIGQLFPRVAIADEPPPEFFRPPHRPAPVTPDLVADTGPAAFDPLPFRSNVQGGNREEQAWLPPS